MYSRPSDAPKIRGSIKPIARKSTSGTAEPTPLNFLPIDIVELRSAAFGVITLGRRTYLLLPADAYGAFDTYDITEGLPSARLLLTTTAPLGTNSNATFTIDFAVCIRGYEAYVYELAPNNGIAAYKYTFTPESTDIRQSTISCQQTIVSKRITPNGIVIDINGHTYTPTGLLIR